MDVKTRLLFADQVLIVCVCAGVIAFKAVQAIQMIGGWL